jgi:hypothetical protein
MNTIKKTTLIAVITAMAAIAVPSLASANVWAPPTVLKTLTSTSSLMYRTLDPTDQFSFNCSSSTLGVRGRNPASSTLDIHSASFTGCTGVRTCSNYPVTITPTGLPWAVTTSGTNLSYTVHLQVAYSPGCGPITLNVDGTMTGSYNNTTHTLTATTPNSPRLVLSYMGNTWDWFYGGVTTSWHETTNTLTLT